MDNKTQPNSETVSDKKDMIDITNITDPFIINPNFVSKSKIMKLLDEKVLDDIRLQYTSGSHSMDSILQSHGINNYYFYKLKDISPKFHIFVENLEKLRAHKLVSDMNTAVIKLEDIIKNETDPKMLNSKTNALNSYIYNAKKLAGMLNVKYKDKVIEGTGDTYNIFFEKLDKRAESLKQRERGETIEAKVIDSDTEHKGDSKPSGT